MQASDVKAITDRVLHNDIALDDEAFLFYLNMSLQELLIDIKPLACIESNDNIGGNEVLIILDSHTHIPKPQEIKSLDESFTLDNDLNYTLAYLIAYNAALNAQSKQNFYRDFLKFRGQYIHKICEANNNDRLCKAQSEIWV